MTGAGGLATSGGGPHRAWWRSSFSPAQSWWLTSVGAWRLRAERPPTSANDINLRGDMSVQPIPRTH